MSDNERLQSYITELRRGSLILAVLGSLKGTHYGYSLLRQLQERGLDIEANTLYPLMRRLEQQGLLTSSWDTSESRPRKYYTISSDGSKLLSELLCEWDRLERQIAAICLREDNNNG